MRHIADQPGFEDAILNSDDDYEPYGYVTPLPVSMETSHHSRIRNAAHDRVIEAQLLRHLGG